MNLLFICSKNQWRSPTAAKIFSKSPPHQARSAGTSSKARRKITQEDVKWADVIMLMEQKHKQRLLANFPDLLKFKELHVLDIPDNFQFMDAERVELLQSAVGGILAERL